MSFFRRYRSVIFRIFFVLTLLTAVLWVSAHTLRPEIPVAAEEAEVTAEPEPEPEPDPALTEPVVAGEVTMDPALTRQVAEIRAAGNIPRVAAPVEDLPIREGENSKTKELLSVPPGTLLAEIAEDGKGSGNARIRVTEPASGVTGYVTATFAPVIEYPLIDPELLPVVRTDTALYTWDEMCEDTDLLCAMYPDILRTEDLKPSTDGRRIPLIILGNPDAKIRVFVQAAIHGREYMTAQLVMKMTEYYAATCATGSYQGTLYRELFDRTVWYIIPMSNPDGVMISQFGEKAALTQVSRQILRDAYAADWNKMTRFKDSNGETAWYDNYRGTYDGYEAEDETITPDDYLKLWKANARGVDLNNNFDAGWETVKGKDHPSMANYPGPKPVSEPETENLVETELRYDYAASISYHSRGNLIYYDADGKKSEIAKRSLVIARILSDMNGYPIEMERSATLNLGGFTDWLQLVCHRPGVTVEVGTYSCPLEIKEFPSIWLKNRESWAALAKALTE